MACRNRSNTHGGKRAGAGRPLGSKNKTPREVAQLAQAYGPEAIERLVAIMRDGGARHSDQIAAIALLLDRAFGKAQQAVDLTVQNYDELSDSELTRIIREEQAAESKTSGVRNGNGNGRRPC